MKGARVLVVEDHWVVANALKSLLEAEGAEVTGLASTTVDAHRLAIGHEFDLAVVDINLKGEMAYGLITQLHDLGVRVVVVSGYAVLPGLTEKAAARASPFAETVQRTRVALRLAPSAFAVTLRVERAGHNAA